MRPWIDIGSLTPSTRTPYRPFSFAFTATTPGLPLSSGFDARFWRRTARPTSRASTEPSGAAASAVGGADAASSHTPIQLTRRTSAPRGAARTAAIQFSRPSSHPFSPTCQPKAVPAATRARSRWLPQSTVKPFSTGFTSGLALSAKPCRCFSIAAAAAKTPPGGAAGRSIFRTTMSNLFAFGCFDCFW